MYTEYTRRTEYGCLFDRITVYTRTYFVNKKDQPIPNSFFLPFFPLTPLFIYRPEAGTSFALQSG